MPALSKMMATAGQSAVGATVKSCCDGGVTLQSRMAQAGVSPTAGLQVRFHNQGAYRPLLFEGICHEFY